MAHLLENYREQAQRAHYGTSLSPEKRADKMIREHSAELAADMEQVAALGGDPEHYQAGYEAKFSAWLSAKSRCLSTMIAGPANFPVRRAEKANESERRRYEEFEQFRSKYMARLRRAQRREEKAASDPVAEMRAQIEQAEKWQELMKAANVIVRKKGATQDEKVAALQNLGISEAAARELFRPDFAGRIGFPAYKLVNNGANIRRMRERLAELEKKAFDGTFEEEYPGGIRVVHNKEADRLQIFFPEKPDAEMIRELKSRAFKWSPSNGCWQRQITSNAKWALANLAQLKF